MCVGGRQREKEWEWEREWEKRRLNLKIFYATEYIFSNKWEKKAETYTTYIIIFDLMLSRFGYCHLHIFNFLYFFLWFDFIWLYQFTIAWCVKRDWSKLYFQSRIFSDFFDKKFVYAENDDGCSVFMLS